MLIATYVKGDKAPTVHRHLQVGQAPITTGKNMRRINGIVTFTNKKQMQNWLTFNMSHTNETLCEWYDQAKVSSEADIFGDEDELSLEFDIVVTDTDRNVDMFGEYSLNVKLECLLEWLMDDAATAQGWLDGKRHNYKAVNDR